MVELIGARQIVVASRDGGQIAGIGRALLDFVEQQGRERGLRAMQLELLVPRAWAHPSKEFLKAWYGRRGYAVVRTTTMQEAHPHPAPLLATPCDLEFREKPLADWGVSAVESSG